MFSKFSRLSKSSFRSPKLSSEPDLISDSRDFLLRLREETRSKGFAVGFPFLNDYFHNVAADIFDARKAEIYYFFFAGNNGKSFFGGIDVGRHNFYPRSFRFFGQKSDSFNVFRLGVHQSRDKFQRMVAF